MIGRHEACDLNFTSLFISRQHCQIQRLLPNGKLTIKNLKQTNTTYVDDIALQDTSKCVELHIGSRIGLGVPLTYATEEGFNNKDYVFLSLLWSTDTVGDTKIVDLDETLDYSSGNSCSAQQLGSTLGHSSAINHTTPCPQSNNANILQHHQIPHYISPPILREDNQPQSHTSTVAHHSLEYASAKSHVSKSSPLTNPPYSAMPCSTSSPHCSTQANPYNSKHLAIESQHMGGPYSKSPYTKPHTSANTHCLIESSDSAKLNHAGSLYDAIPSSYLNKLESRDPSHQRSQQTSGNNSSQSVILQSDNSTAYHRGISSQPAQPILAQHSIPGDESNIIQILVQEKPKLFSTEPVNSSGQPFSYVSSRQVFDVQLPSEKQQISQRDHNENTRPSARVAPLQSNSKQFYPNSDVSHYTESNNCSHVQIPQLPELKHISSSRSLQSQRSDDSSSLLMKENSSPSNPYLGDKFENGCHSQAPYASMNRYLSSRSVKPQLDAENKSESLTDHITSKHQDTKSKNNECRGVIANVTPTVKNDFVICDTSNTDSDNTDCDEIIDLTQNDPDPDSPRGYECDNQLEKHNFTDLTEIQCNSKDVTKRKRDENNKADIELLRTEKEERLSTINSSFELPDINPRGYECDNQLEKHNFTDLTEIQCNSKDVTKRKRDENNKADIELLRTEKVERLSTINSSFELPDINLTEENENASNLNRKKKRIERVSSDAECNYMCEGINQDKETSSGRGSKVDTVFRKDSITECFEKCQNECSVKIVRLPTHIVENFAPASHSELDKPGTSYKLNDKSDDTVDKSKTISNEPCTSGFKSSERPVMKENHKRKRSQNGKDSGMGTKYEKKLKCSDRNGSTNELDKGQTSHNTREESESKSGNRVIAEQDVCLKLEDGASKNREQMPGYEITNREKEKKNCVKLEDITVKIEHSECGPTKLMSSCCSEEDDDGDDDIDIMNYSQVNEAIWISSDEDEESNDSNSSICPLLSSPHLEELFREVKTENMNEDSFDVKESLPVVKREPVEDQWFPILSQSCWDDDDDDVLILEDDKASTSSSPLPAPEVGPHISSPNSEDDMDGNNHEWWPQLSQGFFDEEEEEGVSKESGDSNKDFLVPSTSTPRNLKQKNKAHSVFEKTSHKESNLQERDSKSHKLSRKSAPKKVTVADNTDGHSASWMDDLDGNDEPIPDLHMKLPGVSTSSLPGPSHLHNSPPTSNNDDQDDWSPELSRAFLDSNGEEKNGNECRDRCKDGDQVNKDFQKASKSSDNLSNIVSKLKHTQQRKSLLTSPKAPPPRKKGKKGGTSCPEFYGKSVEERAVSEKSSSEKTKNDRRGKTARPTEGSKQKKKDKKQQSLRDNLTSKFNLQPYKATLEQKAKENHHLVPKSKTNSSNKLQIHPPSSDSTSLNISIQNRSKLKDSEGQEKSRPKVAAKVTKKSRSEKLIDIDIFKNVPASRSVSKRSNFKIPKTTVNTKESSEGPSSSGVEGVSSIIPVLTNKVKESSNVTINSQSRKLQTVPSIGKERQENCKVLPKPVTDKNQRSVDGNVTKRGILKSLPENTNGPEKNVRFPTDEKDLLSIRAISPRKKKECLGIPEVRAREMNPLILNKDQMCQTFMDSFIHHICTWNFEWLEQYHNKMEKTETQERGHVVKPPPVGSSESYPTLILYDSYDDYKDIFSNLIYLEVWENVYKDWLQFRDSNIALPALIDVMQPAITSTQSQTLKFWTLKLYTLITVNQDIHGYHPRQGSLICLKIQEGNRKYRMFGYVDYMSKNKRCAVTNELKAACPHGTVCLLLGIRVTKQPITKVRPGKIVSINHVSYLRPSTRIWEGLCLLPHSPLCNSILKPNIQAFQKCNNNDSQYLVEAMSMNDVQQKAVVEVSNKCLFDSQIPKLSLIHGPPGTGKTRTITALIAQMIVLGQKLQSEGRGQGCRILLCAPSNAAVDELTLRLAKLREINICLRIVRAGVKESIRNDVQSYTLDAYVEKQVRMELATPKNKSMRQEWQRRKCMAVKAAEELQNARQENKNQAEILQMEMRLCELVRSKDDLERSFQTQHTVQDRQNLQRKWQDKILLGAEVVTTTLGSCISGVMGDAFTRHPNHFTCCIVDEAGQCQETDTWLPLLLGVRKLVLVGDHRQLPATVLSRLAKDKNLKQSLFERLYHRIVVELQEDIYVHALNTQYRMHPEIAKWPSQHFYQGKLATSPTIVQARTHALKPYIFFDLKSSQEQRHQGKELYNPTEASLIYNICEALQVQGCKEKIAVITPYLRQKFSLDGRLSKFHRCLDLVISTIDAFQGQERDIVILSFVRGNIFSKIGFLAQRQRLNVALTRARKSCFVVASLSSLSDNTDYKSLVEDAKKRRVVCTITEKEENDKSYLKFLYK
ncbi:hypothetical protein Pmani_034174 [Petrolisthes manimaculis]|uniref:FHA domain-containing protein n=1 Tax=Petrolisthes manimaculis TaxID=1843537 RepID=A0AAE1NQG6_9EUCA|nr:hypothetical protein Pmani_034174 [Petrolisthes manimaculis]